MKNIFLRAGVVASGGMVAHIVNMKQMRVAASISSVFLVVFSMLAVFPVAGYSAVEASSIVSDTVLTLSTSDISLEFNITNPMGTFAESTPAELNVTTNNYTGYTLAVTAKENNANSSRLINSIIKEGVTTDYALNSISTAGGSTDFNNGNWGYMPSKYNSAANTDYLPAPSYAGDTLDVTNVANNNANTYTISLGAKADYSLPAGVYNNTFVIVATANPVGYTITYDANTDDPSVAGIPAQQSGEATVTSVVLSSNVPTRTGYTFNGWCFDTIIAIDGIDTCDSTVYNPGANYDTDQTIQNIVALKAMWNRTYTITFDANTGTGTMPTQIITGSSATLNTNLFAKTDYDFDGWNTSDDGDGYAYADGATFTVPATGTGTTFYAQWKLHTYPTFEQAFVAAGKTKDATADKYKMQDMNSTICSAVTTPTNTTDYSDTPEAQLVDIRDGKIYWVAKLLDGKCWMTQNLDHNIVTIAGYYTHDNTDLGWGSDTTTTTWTPTRATIPTSSISSSGAISGWTNNYNTPYSVDTGDWYWTDTWYTSTINNYLNIDGSGAGDKFSQTPYTGNGTHGHVGNYYNWSAAVASNDTSSYDDAYGSSYNDITNNPQNSICPAGWRLPTIYNSATDSKNEYRYLLDKYGAYVKSGSERDKALTASPLYFVRSGYVVSGSLGNSGRYGYYWSSTVDNSGRAYYLSFGSGAVGPTDLYGRTVGQSLRCVAR